jgi:dipeptidyl aminopeptidase/acylaminoacyl peptidase
MTDKAISFRRRELCMAGGLSPLLTTLWPGAAAAQDKPPPVADFFKRPNISAVRRAPGGKHIAALREVNGRANATVVDTTTRKAVVVTNFSDADVAALGWVNENRLVFSLTDRSRGSGDQFSGGLFVVDRDGSNFRPLVERSLFTEGGRQLAAGSTFHSRIFENGKWSDEILVQVPSRMERGESSSNVYRVNTSNGQSSLLTLGGPTNAIAWVFDRDVVARVALSQVGGATRFHYRDGADKPWRQLFEVGASEVTKTVVPLAFDAKGQLYVSAYAGQDNAAIYRFDTAAGRLDPEPVFAAKGFDVDGGLVFSDDGARLRGVRYDGDRERTYWIDEEVAKIQKQIDATLPDTVNSLQPGQGGEDALTIVSSYSDRDPGRYYLFDAKKKQIEQIAVQRPWINPSAMSPTRVLIYRARDGMSIPAQLTVPRGQEAKKSPLVVLHFGGPWVRPFEWRWNEIVQFLASRGYAVFMPAPRGSTGFGAKLFTAGWKQWGLGMQDDVTDGVRALIADGVVDANRVGIAGASYGGYLAMMALVKEPELFKCAINWVGVTDPSFMFSVTWTDFNRVDSGRFRLPLLIGDPDKDAEQFKRTSPVERAAEIKQPVLMAYGGLDQRVPIVNGERMRSALAGHNKKVEWVVYPDEGHGWMKLESNVDFWTRAEKFLAANL